MNNRIRISFLIFIAILFLAQCATKKEEKAKEVRVSKQNIKPVQPVVNNPVNKPEKPEITPKKQPLKSNSKEFVITKELYNKTFDEIEETIRNLNKIITTKDYKSWRDYLTEDYINKRSDPSFLEKMSSSNILKQKKIKLKTLEDYFDYVVVPSRASARLDKIEMIDENHVKAITILNNTPIILYWLVKDKGRWKIGVR